MRSYAAAPPSPAPRRDPRLDQLTPRELEVLGLLARGRSNQDIATTLFVSEGTTKTHVSNVLMKLDLRDRVQAVVFAYENGVVVPAGRRHPWVRNQSLDRCRNPVVGQIRLRRSSRRLGPTQPSRLTRRTTVMATIATATATPSSPAPPPRAAARLPLARPAARVPGRGARARRAVPDRRRRRRPGVRDRRPADARDLHRQPRGPPVQVAGLQVGVRLLDRPRAARRALRPGQGLGHRDPRRLRRLRRSHHDAGPAGLGLVRVGDRPAVRRRRHRPRLRPHGGHHVGPAGLHDARA